MDQNQPLPVIPIDVDAVFFDNDPGHFRPFNFDGSRVFCQHVEETPLQIEGGHIVSNDDYLKAFANDNPYAYMRMLWMQIHKASTGEDVSSSNAHHPTRAYHQGHDAQLNAWLDAKKQRGEPAYVIFDWDRTLSCCEGFFYQLVGRAGGQLMKELSNVCMQRVAKFKEDIDHADKSYFNTRQEIEKLVEEMTVTPESSLSSLSSQVISLKEKLKNQESVRISRDQLMNDSQNWVYLMGICLGMSPYVKFDTNQSYKHLLSFLLDPLPWLDPSYAKRKEGRLHMIQRTLARIPAENLIVLTSNTGIWTHSMHGPRENPTYKENRDFSSNRQSFLRMLRYLKPDFIDENLVSSFQNVGSKPALLGKFQSLQICNNGKFSHLCRRPQSQPASNSAASVASAASTSASTIPSDNMLTTTSIQPASGGGLKTRKQKILRKSRRSSRRRIRHFSIRRTVVSSKNKNNNNKKKNWRAATRRHSQDRRRK
jgi:hypothetical protein